MHCIKHHLNKVYHGNEYLKTMVYGIEWKYSTVLDSITKKETTKRVCMYMWSNLRAAMLFLFCYLVSDWLNFIYLELDSSSR